MTQNNQYEDEANAIVTYQEREQYFVAAVNEGNQEKALAVAPHLGYIDRYHASNLLTALKQATENNWADVIEVAASNIVGHGCEFTIFKAAIESDSMESALAMVNEIKIDPVYNGILEDAAQKGMLPVIEALNNNDQFTNIRQEAYEYLIQTAMENATPEQVERHHKAQTLYELGTAMANIRDGDVSEFYAEFEDEIEEMLSILGVEHQPDNEPEQGVPLQNPGI